MGVQTLAGVFMVWQGWRLSLFIDAPVVTGALSVIWIVGLVNTFNMLDNMDGLSAGIAAIAAILLAAVILTAPDPITKGPQLFVGGFLLVLVGALVGFLWHNWPPARLFMGDAGSYLIGFCLATITISATFAGEGLPRHAILAPLCVLAVPIYDTITVVWIRLRERRSPFQADRNHISHRLVDLGLNKRQAVTVVYAATAVCGAGAFFLHRTNTTGALLILSFIAAVLFAIAAVELTARKRRAGTPAK
jgi:UDP-GlcNAc:undecaprenyl-phosphate GlcNAc-1-phosphate transferase